MGYSGIWQPCPSQKLPAVHQFCLAIASRCVFCRRTLHLCHRYPFRLLVKSVSAVSGRDIMVVKLLPFFWVFLSFFVVLICFLFCFVFVWLFVCCCFCFLFLLKNSFLLIVYLSCGFLILFYVSFFVKKNPTDKDTLPIAVRKEKHNTWTHRLLWSIACPQKCPAAAGYSLNKFRVMCNAVSPQVKTT